MKLAATATKKFQPRDVLADRTLTTIRDERIPLLAPDRLTHLQFRRFAGCPICNIHLRAVAKRHDELVDAGLREVVVFHSSAEHMRPHQGELPFAAIADPQKKLYREFGVETSRRSVLHPRAWSTPLNWRSWVVVIKGLRAGGFPGPPRGESILGLPADFLIAPDGRIVAAKYGEHANDQWSVTELLELAASWR